MIKPLNLTGRTRHGHTRAGGWKSRTYISWQAAKRRCIYPKDRKYPMYGGRGITMCGRWLHSFENFVEDMGERPAHTTLDRKESTGNYEPSNCKWATATEQNRHRSNTRFITFNGVTQTLREWAKVQKLHPTTLWFRLKRGWTVEEALTN